MSKICYNTFLPYVDISIGGFGIPIPSIIQLYGASDTAKSSISLFFVKYFFRDIIKSKFLYVDSEFKIDEVRFKFIMDKYSIKPDDYEVYQENDVEKVFNKIYKFVLNNAADGYQSIVVLDTIANLISDNEGGYSGAKIVSIITSELSKLSKLINKTKSQLLILNQLRDNVSGMGKKYKVPRGRQLSHIVNASMMLKSSKHVQSELDKISFSKKNIVSYSMEKNHLFIPKMKGIFIVDESGVNELESLIEYCAENRIIKVAGSWKSIEFKGNSYKFQNVEKFKDIVVSNQELVDYIHYLIYKKHLTLSPLSFVKLINKVNEFEEKLGLEKTEIPDEMKKYIEKMSEV